MYYIKYSLVLLINVLILSACSNSREDKKEETVALMQANWSDTTALAKAIDVFYKDSVLGKGKVSLEVRDGIISSNNPYTYLQLHKIYRPKFKLTSPTVGYMPVLMLSGNDSAIVDFQISWLQPNLADSLGKFLVTDTFLQLMKNTPRYEWVKEEEYWTRKNVEAPEM